MLKKPRCLQVFEQSLTLEITRINYLGRLDAFMKFLEIENYDRLIKTDPETLQINPPELEFYFYKVSELLEKGEVSMETESSIGKQYGQVFIDNSKHW